MTAGVAEAGLHGQWCKYSVSTVALPVLHETRMRQVLYLLAGVQLFLGAFLVIAPGTFVDLLLTVLAGWVLAGAARLAQR